MDSLLDALLLPIVEPSPSSHSAIPAKFLRQMLLRQPGLQDEENRRQRLTMVDQFAAWISFPPPFWQAATKVR